MPLINSDTLYKVGDVIIFNINRECGYVIEARGDTVKIVNDRGIIKSVRTVEIDKKHVVDRKSQTKDSKGNII